MKRSAFFFLLIIICFFQIGCDDTKNLSAFEYFEKAELCLERGNYKIAMEYLTSAIELDPLNCEFYNSRGYAHYNLREYEKAIADYTEALRLESELGVAYYWRSQCYFNTNEYEKAAADQASLQRLVPMQ
jgi:tetratricopeptide (TPR) repeat protein